MSEYKINPDRSLPEDEHTGIYVRGKDVDGNWVNLDLYQLDRPSLIAFLHSRGGKNEWAENIVLALMGYEQQ